MNKLKWMVAVFLVFLSTAFVDKNAKPGEGLSEGSSAPSICFDNFNLEAYKGRKVLITFWAAYDAQSRVENSLLAASVGKNPGEIELVSFAFDESPMIFEETVRIDHLDRNTQYHVRDGDTSEIFRAYRLKDGFANYLINEDGVIIAKNLDPKKLRELMSMN